MPRLSEVQQDNVIGHLEASDSQLTIERLLNVLQRTLSKSLWIALILKAFSVRK